MNGRMTAPCGRFSETGGFGWLIAVGRIENSGDDSTYEKWILRPAMTLTTVIP